ncbi:MAG: riboflavin synthase [Kiritimatiellae bacterium]|nr:riboflavin synthase [Kiritimatiellia bacterium]
MFTGIIQKAGKIKHIKCGRDSGHIEVEIHDLWGEPLQQGESISVQGVCLTVISSTDDIVQFDVLAETFNRTTLSDKVPGTFVNLERALKVGDPMGGHIVQGHVDGVGDIEAINKKGQDRYVKIACHAELTNQMVFKGSIAVDGISLTLVEVANESFSIYMIPHTWRSTSFKELTKGSRVNLETDIVAKYVQRCLKQGDRPDNVTWEALKKSGLTNNS